MPWNDGVVFGSKPVLLFADISLPLHLQFPALTSCMVLSSRDRCPPCVVVLPCFPQWQRLCSTPLGRKTCFLFDMRTGHRTTMGRSMPTSMFPRWHYGLCSVCLYQCQGHCASIIHPRIVCIVKKSVEIGFKVSMQIDIL